MLALKYTQRAAVVLLTSLFLGCLLRQLKIKQHAYCALQKNQHCLHLVVV